jgi:hypothetical protein
MDLVPLNDVDALCAAGIAYPATVHGWRWLFRHREQRGLSNAFKRVGKRILVDVPTYTRLIRDQMTA